ncbi:MAG: YdcF family protein [Eubacteriales bacterium]|nr:YdcF family protein [Eubacteriales bacterium]
MQTVLITAGAVILLLFVLPLFHGVLNAGNFCGMASGVASLVIGITWNSYSFNERKIFAFVILFVIIAFTALCVSVVKSGKSNAKGQKVLIVLGCRVKGYTPSVALQKRVDSAYFYLLQNPNAVAVLSGGKGRDEFISEAQCMKNMLTDRGISADRLFLEDKSTSTYENIRFSMKYFEQLGTDEIAVATSEYHQKRAQLICRRFGLTAYAVSSKTAPSLLPTFALRELFALAKEYMMR